MGQSALNWMGFRHNLLTRVPMGIEREGAGSTTLAAMLVIAGLLALPILALSIISWMAGAGALIEVWAVNRCPGSARSL